MKKPLHSAFLWHVIIFLWLFIILRGAGELYADIRVIKIGVLAKRGPEICLKQWSPTAEYLTATLPEYSFTIIPLAFDQIVLAVERSEIDFVLANSAIYAGLEAVHGASCIATMKNLLYHKESTVFGGTVFYKAGRDDIHTLHDLSGKSFMAVDRTSLGGWLMASREMKLYNINPDRDFSSLDFAGTHDAVVYAVMAGQVDAGTVRTDTLERMAAENKIRLDDFKIIPFLFDFDPNRVDSFIQKTTYQEFPFLFSTHLYPEWPFAKLRQTPDDLAKKVAIALFNVTADCNAAKSAEISGWTIPLQYQSVRECLRELRVWPYQDFGKFSVIDVIKEYRYWIMLTLAGIVALSVLSIIVMSLNKILAHQKIVLEQYRDELEKRVEERTAELTLANESLKQKIIAKQQDEEKLKRWAQIFQHAEWGVVVCQVIEEKIELMNPAFAKMHDYSIEELTGQSCVHVFAQEERENISKNMMIAHRLGHHTFESIHIKKDGTRFPVWLDITVLRSPDGKPQYHVVNVQDISQRKIVEEEKKQLESDLRQAQKMEAIGTLAGGIAHDFNNILSVIIGYAQLAQLEIPPDNKAQNNINEVLKAGKRATELVRQILTFSRKSEHLQQTFSPHTIIKETLKMLRSSLPTTITIQEEIDPDCGLILADPTKVHQILLNLCTNAFHAMEKKIGILDVRLYRKDVRAEEIREDRIEPGPFVVLSITDTGHGMDKAIIERIFDPYFTTKEVGKGTGLGLAVVQGIVLDYKGFIEVESEVGKGSSFHVYLPALPKDAVIFEEMKQDDLLSTGTEEILVVDDESTIANLNKTLLEQLGYKVTAVINSVEALEKIRTNPQQFDLVITDQTMPNMAGIELAQEILKIKPQMPIILCTGYSSAITEEEALSTGIKKYITKPVDRKKIANLVRLVLDQGS